MHRNILSRRIKCQAASRDTSKKYFSYDRYYPTYKILLSNRLQDHLCFVDKKLSITENRSLTVILTKSDQTGKLDIDAKDL